MDSSQSEAGAPIRGINKICTILVVDDELEMLDEYRETISSLGYSVVCVSNPLEALEQIARSRDIGVVITDLDMPIMDGISFLSEIAHRFSLTRPLITLVLTGHASLDMATKAMQSYATDFLTKPVSLTNIAGALRRATSQYFAMAQLFHTAARADQNVQYDQENSAESDAAPSGHQLQSFAQMLLKVQHSKSKFFDPAVLSGPSWEILFDIAETNLRGEALSASSAAGSSFLPLSTALRRVNNLVEAGLIRSWTDPTDKRRTMLELEPHALVAMQAYLKSAWLLHTQNR